MNAKQLKKAFPDNQRLYQCPECSYGPIYHTNCGDLAAHNGNKSGTGKISNRCPKCNYFSRYIRNWKRWDERNFKK